MSRLCGPQGLLTWSILHNWSMTSCEHGLLGCWITLGLNWMDAHTSRLGSTSAGREPQPRLQTWISADNPKLQASVSLQGDKGSEHLRSLHAGQHRACQVTRELQLWILNISKANCNAMQTGGGEGEGADQHRAHVEGAHRAGGPALPALPAPHLLPHHPGTRSGAHLTLVCDFVLRDLHLERFREYRHMGRDCLDVCFLPCLPDLRPHQPGTQLM